MHSLSNYAILAALSLGALVGCGGGGGNSDKSYPSPTTTQLKTLVPVDYVYKLSGKVTANGATKNLSAQDSFRTLRVIQDSSSASNVFSLTTTDTLVPESGSPSALRLREDVAQQSDRSVVLNVVNNSGAEGGGTDKTIQNSSVVLIPGTFATNTDSGTQTLRFTDGTTASYTFSIGGRRSITLPQGTYNTYVVNSTLTFAADDKRSSVFYYAPETGTYVKATETIVRPGGFSATLESTLSIQ